LSKLLLCHVHLAIVHEVEDLLEVAKLDTFQVEKWVGVRVPLQNSSEERRAGGNYHLSLETRICNKKHFKRL